MTVGAKFASVHRILIVVLMIGFSNSARGQNLLGGVEPRGEYPSQQYYLALEIYRSGDLEQALEAFDMAMGRTRRDINGQWIDAIPVHAMQAECYWHLGNLPACRASLDQAFAIAIRHRGWLSKADWQSALKPGAVVAQEDGLWPAAAAIRRVPLSDKMMFRSGQQLTERALTTPGAFEQANIKRIDVIEVMRGLAIASYRRRVLLGPLAEQESLASELLEATKYPAGLQLPLARTFIGSMRAAERFAILDDQRAVADSQETSRYNGAVHPLSPLAGLAQISVLAGSEQSPAAVPVAIDVAAAAAALGQPEWIGEAMQLAAGCATPATAGAVQETASTAAMAMLRESRLATLHCLIAAADAAITGGQIQAAEKLLADAQGLSERRDVLQPRLDAYGAYVAARLASALGESVGTVSPTAVDAALDSLQSFAFNRRFRNRPTVSMPRQYQLGLITQSVGRSIGGTTSENLLEAYCGQPPIEVWRRDPVDALAAVLADSSAAEAIWIGLAANQTGGEDLLRRSDIVLASRFYRRLPLGGRLAQVRRLASADAASLDKQSSEFIAAAPPLFTDLRQAAGAPMPADLAAARSEAVRLESLACRLALERLPFPRAMPPASDSSLPSSALPDGAGMLTFFFAGNRLHGTLTAEGKTTKWAVNGSNRLPLEIGRVLKGIGVGRTRGKRLPEDEAWKEAAVALRQRLVPDDLAISADRFDDLIIVPDGPLWYLPFELLPLGDVDSDLLGSAISVRYAATPGLALHPVAPPAVQQTVGIAAGSFFAPRDVEANQAAIEAIVDAVAEPVRLPGEEPIPGSLLGQSLGHLMVAAPQAMDPSDPFAFSVAAYDSGSPAGTLAAWMRFPAVAPRTVILSGFRTPVGSGKMGSGQEIFVALCALHASGVRDVMLSRWAVGGQSTAIAMKELLQELPFIGLQAAWTRARGLLRESELDPSKEPLLMQSEHEREGLTGSQPLFWASYLVASPFVAEAKP